MKRTTFLVSLLALGMMLFAACGQGNKEPVTTQAVEVKVDGGAYYNVTPAQLAEMLKNKNFPLVNVHIPYDGEIAPTNLFVPYNAIEKNLAKFPGDKGAKIVLYCRSGSMSSAAATEMVKLGYTNVWNLDGGMVRWEKEGNKLLRK